MLCLPSHPEAEGAAPPLPAARAGSGGGPLMRTPRRSPAAGRGHRGAGAVRRRTAMAARGASLCLALLWLSAAPLPRGARGSEPLGPAEPSGGAGPGERFKIEGRAVVPGVKPQDWIAGARVLVDGEEHVGFLKWEAGGAGQGLGRACPAGAGVSRGRGAHSQFGPAQPWDGGRRGRLLQGSAVSWSARPRDRGTAESRAELRAVLWTLGPGLVMGWARPALQCRRVWPQPPAGLSGLMAQVAAQKLRNGVLIQTNKRKNNSQNRNPRRVCAVWRTVFLLSFSCKFCHFLFKKLTLTKNLPDVDVFGHVRSYSCSSVLSTREKLKLCWWKLI